jgi:RNA polymerase sigma-70 factor (ECF subfamily)
VVILTGIPRDLDSTTLQPEQAQVSDVHLLHSIARRDEQALASLYDRYHRILFGLLVRILSSREEAEDILQEVFLQVWRRAADFDEHRGRPFAWLVSLARHRAIDRLRLHSSLARASVRETGDDVSDTAQATLEQREIVADALAQLTDEQKQVLILAYFEGLTQAEIAARLGVPLPRVRTHMRSGMIRVRELLSGKVESLLETKG